MQRVFEFLQTLPGILLIMFIGTSWLLASVIGTWARHWRDVRLALAAAELKAKMIERGMSAEEIERVLRADSGGALALNRSRQKDSPLYSMIENGAEATGMVQVIQAGLPAKEAAADVAYWMSENGYEGEDIARVVAALRAAQTPDPATPMPADRRPLPDIDLEVREPHAPASA